MGREREQAKLREHLDQMLAGQGGTVLAGGEAGIGKTTLVEDLGIEAEERGCLVLWGHAYDLSVTPPYGPWLEIFRAYRSVGSDLPPLPTFIGDLEETAALGSQDRLFNAVRSFLETVSAARPLVLVLDDLHWADQASLEFFRYLAREVGRERVLLVATYRTDELHRHHPLFTLLPLVVREAGAERLEVRRLDELGHRALIRSRHALDAADEDRLDRYLEERAEGNPLYASELLRMLEERGILVSRDETWTLGKLDDIRVPTLLRQVIEARVDRLGEQSAALLDVASVIGQEVRLSLWQDVSEADELAFLSAVEAAEAASILEARPDGLSVRFRHALIREALYERVLPLRRRVWHRTVAGILAEEESPRSRRGCLSLSTGR